MNCLRWQLKLQGLTAASRSVDSLVYTLWALLPSFCNYPVDTVESFVDLGQILCGALQTQVETRGIICTSLNILIQQNKEIVDGKEVSADDASPAMLRATARYDSHHAAANLKVLRSCAPRLLDVLSRIFHESGKDDGGSLQVIINLKGQGIRLSSKLGLHHRNYDGLEYNISSLVDIRACSSLCCLLV